MVRAKHAGLPVEFRLAVAVGHHVRAEPDRLIHRRPEVRVGVVVGLDQHDPAVRADRRGHVHIQRLLDRPARVGRWVAALLAVLVHLGEAREVGVAGGQAVGSPVDGQVRLRVRVVKGVDDRDRLPRAEQRRR